ncbi:pirin family protein [Undibacterium terreum]|uniref:Pirin-like protein n=1 Tax=Undibacterium terreum TaxID=1224302 RepID=A0A916V0F8_9BURK|nr:pirin family protein [Undibacterium terreum]GGD00565.1 pirin-like protein [Undibacterium terreum]
MLQHRPRTELDGGDFGWLKAKHHFVVSDKGNFTHHALGALVVWNDDEIAPGTGFPLHGHKDMEIISYVRQGTVSHRDNTGNEGQTAAGDVQVMSAGSGILHEEYNSGSIPLKLFQIWIRPREPGGAPRWDTRPFPKEDRAGRLVPLASGVPSDDGALLIRADARVLGAALKAGQRVDYFLGIDSNAYLVPALGTLTVNGVRVEMGDGVAIIGETHITIEAIEDSEFILVEVL